MPTDMAASRPSADQDLVPRVVVVYGAPASGKTTVASAVSARFGLPAFERDAFKEVLAAALPGVGREWSRQLGAASYAVLLHTARTLAPFAGGAVLVTNGTEEYLSSLVAIWADRGVGVVGLECVAPSRLLEERFARRVRADVHGGKDLVDELRPQFNLRLGPLSNLAAYREIDTELSVSACIEQALAAVSNAWTTSARGADANAN